ncbi:recombinase family protein [Desulfitobacterium sp.]|uniref:recombinase family protein n=1 Tax=Desulfitobacterium sp. TaxID=49981 RepID=UPI002B85D6D0|nr:recombinase family protein [Desulfitobacterium sp.]HVJ50657.1 recombinase family protein [Desulfitobacterium sp.]
MSNVLDKAAYLKGIKHVGIYIRKSRLTGDLDEKETLAKHRTELVNFAKENKLEHTIFEEVVSGGKSDNRAEFNRMLNLTALEVYDALVVINWDRLTRNEADGARLTKTLRDSETVVIQLNPFEIIDLNNDGDVDKTSFMTFFGAWELRQIGRRNRAGKVRAALAGKWIGTVPFGYSRNHSTGFLEINEPQAEVYRRIVEMFLSGMTPRTILYTLNVENVPSPKGGEWNDTVVRRMLVDDVYTGTATFGKAKYIDRKIKKDKPRDEWIVVSNSHPAIIDEAKHNEILNNFDARKRINGRAQHGKHALSGLLICPVCGGALHFAKTPRGVWIRKCATVDAVGNRCANTDKGVAVAVVTEAIANQLEKHKATLLNPVKDTPDDKEKIDTKIKKIQADLAKMDKAAERLLELYEFGDIERAVYNERKARRLEKRAGVERQLAELYERANKNTTAAERIKAIDAVVEAIRNNDGSAEHIEKINKGLQRIIEKIIYHNDGEELTLDVHYN